MIDICTCNEDTLIVESYRKIANPVRLKDTVNTTEVLQQHNLTDTMSHLNSTYGDVFIMSEAQQC